MTIVSGEGTRGRAEDGQGEGKDEVIVRGQRTIACGGGEDKMIVIMCSKGRQGEGKDETIAARAGRAQDDRVRGEGRQGEGR